MITRNKMYLVQFEIIFIILTSMLFLSHALPNMQSLQQQRIIIFMILTASLSLIFDKILGLISDCFIDFKEKKNDLFSKSLPFIYWLRQHSILIVVIIVTWRGIFL